jgi:predicted DsbA family dithiol-disulfide isomerase
MAAPGELSAEAIMKAVRAIGADDAIVKKCLDGVKHRPAVQKDMADAQAAAITGTPSFVLGRGTGEQVAGELIVGAQPYEVFDARLRELLGAKP